MDRIVGRPRGPVRHAVGAVLEQPGMTRDLAARAQLAVVHTRRTLDNMRRSGQITVIEQRRVAGVKRPVPVYAITQNLERQPEAPGAQLHIFFFRQPCAAEA